MKSATTILVALTVFTSLFLESSGSGSDGLMLGERMESSNRALEKCIQAVGNGLDNCTDEYRDGLTRAWEWLTKEVKPLVEKTHSKLEQANQGTSEERKAMASELRTIIEQLSAELIIIFTNIPKIIKEVMEENILIGIIGNAESVCEAYSEGRRY